MTEVKKLEQLGTNAVKRLRIEKLKNGNPFMINSKDLPIDQCYLEYANGKIVLVSFSSGSHDFIKIRELTNQESSALRYKFELDDISI
jgi:hypothetical protein